MHLGAYIKSLRLACMRPCIRKEKEEKSGIKASHRHWLSLLFPLLTGLEPGELCLLNKGLFSICWVLEV